MSEHRSIRQARARAAVHYLQAQHRRGQTLTKETLIVTLFVDLLSDDTLRVELTSWLSHAAEIHELELRARGSRPA